jgi:hypothetical protein
MRKWALGIAVAMLALAAPGAKAAPAQGRPLKLVLARQSTVDPVGIMKNLSQHCPNIVLTTNQKQSDYMLYAGGWSGNYRFMIIAHGGDSIYATQTTLLSNAVKDVCRFLNAQPPRGGPAY